jgi:TonB family protein
MKKLALNFTFALLALTYSFSSHSFALQGEEGSRARSPAKSRSPKVVTARTVTKRRVRKNVPARGGATKPNEEVEAASPSALATLAVSVSPLDAAVFVDGQKFGSRDQLGRRIATLKPGTYSITANKPGYLEQTQSITLVAGKGESLTIILPPQPGSLNINPPVAGSTIVIRNKEKDSVIGQYSESVTGLNVAPGHYQIAISKSGYRTATRDVTIKSGDAIYLEPQLEKETVVAESATKLEALRQGKEIVISLRGRSGDTTAPTGSLDVTVNASGDGGTVDGALTGLPCQVDFVGLENIAEYSFTETPDSSNQWAKVVVRVRPEDSRRSIHFAINWSPPQARPLQTTAKPAPTKPIPAPTEAASIVKKVSPHYPPEARKVRVSGIVVVSVEIDEQGNVTAAKAIEGPGLLRQAAEKAARGWKFRSALSNGRAAKSSQTIKFVFQL